MKTKFIKRILAIYSRDQTAIFFSFLAVLITLFIYLFFLRTSILESMPTHFAAKSFVDLWMVAGLISIVSISASLSPFEQRIKDNLQHRQTDFIINNNMTKLSVSLSYLIAAIIEATISTLAFILIAFGYLYIQDKSLLSINMLLQTIGFSLCLVLFACLFFAVITNLVNSISVFSSLSAIVGALTGFFSGSYVIYSDLPKFMQQLITAWPGYGVAGVLRRIMVKNITLPDDVQQHLFTNLGILLKNDSMIRSVTVWFVILFLVLIAESIISKNNREL